MWAALFALRGIRNLSEKGLLLNSWGIDPMSIGSVMPSPAILALQAFRVCVHPLSTPQCISWDSGVGSLSHKKEEYS
jgi:hypothetical protein